MKSQPHDTNNDPVYLDTDEDEIDLRETIGFLLQNKFIILGIALLIFLSGVAYAFLAAPIYKADALVQIEKSEGPMRALFDIGVLPDSVDVSANTEIEILCSRSVAGKVVQDLKLDVIAAPIQFPIIGAAIARLHKEDAPSAPFFGLDSFAWGGETICIESLKVPAKLLNHTLLLVTGKGGGFEVFDPDDQLLLQGEVGKPAIGHDVRLFVSRLEARPGTRFSLVRQPRGKAILNLQKAMQVSEKGRQTGIITVALEGDDPQKTTDIVNAFVENYLRQNVERRSEESQKMLEFLGKQVPRIHNELQIAETALGDYRSKTGTLGMSIEAQAFVNASVEIEQQIAMVRLQEAELEQRFTGSHPTLVAIRGKISQLEAERRKLSGRIKNLPERELEAVRLERDMRVANTVYTQLLNKVQELSVTKAGTIGNVRIIDPAERPSGSVKPRKLLTVVVSLLAGLFMGTGFVYVRRLLWKGVEDPEKVERKLGLPVYGSIPHSKEQATADRVTSRRRNGKKGRFLLAEKFPRDLAIESLRSLRTSLQFAMMDSVNKVIMITGAGLGVGKSFTSVNLAATLAEAGRKVLLMDADMRKGTLHSVFGLDRTGGLSGMISGESSIEKNILSDVYAGMDFIPCGIVPPNPSELLMSDRFLNLVNKLSRLYDIILIDTPPVLAVTDACIVGRAAGVCFMVLGYGDHHIREIELAKKRLMQSGVKVQGVIFNNMPMGVGYGYGKYYS